MKKKNKVFFTIAIVMLVAGVTLLLFPTISKTIDKSKNEKKYIEFIELNNVSDTDNKEATKATRKETSKESKKNKILLDKLYKDILKYNTDLYEKGQGVLDPFVFDKPSLNLKDYGVEDGIFGYIHSPVIDMKLPIYLGANDNNMYYGAGNLSQTSIPIGGKNTNSVFSAHTGMIRKSMFDNIVNLEKGDTIYVTNFWTKLEYKVIDMYIILPNESSNILIQEDKDLITLLTCYPYGYSDQRYVVVCERN